MLHLRPVAATGDPVDRKAPPPIPLAWIAVPGAVLVTMVGLYVWRFEKTPSAHTIGDFGILIAVATAALSCGWAARTTTKERLAWALLSVAATLWTIAQVIYTYYGLTRNNVYPYPSLADLMYLSYSLPAALALFAFPRVKRRGSSWVRGLIDALVIALSVMFISWATVLRDVFGAGGEFDVVRVTGLAYPGVDVLVASLVLALGMRRPAGQRMPWLFMGTGLIVLAITDSAYVDLLNQGETGLTGTILSAGWMAAWLLVACAPWVRRSAAKADSQEGAAVLIDLAPYVLFFMVLVTSAGFQDTTDLFMRVIGWTLLLLIVVRQMMIVHENVTLTRDLELKVRSRTTELAGLASIVQSSSDAIIATDIQGTIRSWNPGAGWIFGYSESQMAGRQLAELVSPDPLDEPRQRLEAVLDQVRRGEQVRNYEADWPRADGSIVPVAFTFSPISDDDVLQGISVIGQDVTERRAVQRDLEIARSEALESSRLKSQFLATMSHEIRTPMNGVIGLTSLLLETPLDATQRQYAEGVSGAGEALLSVINDILDFSKLEAGKVELDLGVFDPRLLIDEVASLVMLPAHGKRLELVAYCQPGVPQMLVGDGGRLRQILLNLASNAVKFTARGEVTVTARSLPVTTDTARADDSPDRARIRFEVADTGIGLAPAARGTVFESFSQADASTTRRYGGTGLGLAISRRLTEVMGGTIGVDSELDVGSTFWFEVTLSVATGTNAHGVTLSHEMLDDVPVLVVDDNATNLLMLQSQLTSWRMQPTAVDGGYAALTLLRNAAAAGTPFPVAVLDMEMPGIDGLEVARRISADRTLAATRVVMLTSSMSVEASEMRQAGVGEWLTKPVRSSVLYDRLMRLMAPKDVVTPAPTQHSTTQPAGSLGRVLVVEDNALNQLVAEGVVTKLGYHVDIVANGAEALTAIQGTFYSAVLMDCHMPVMDGFAATEEIRRRGGDDAIPIIAMTAGAMAEDRDRCLAVGMNDYVSKPVNVSAVSEALARWARTSPAEAAATRSPATATAQAVGADGGDRVLDAGRQQLLRELGPDDGWGILPAAVEAFLSDTPQIVASLRLAVASGDARRFGEGVHQLKGAAANIGVVQVFELCQGVEDGGSGLAAPDGALVDRIEAELDRAAPALHEALAPAR